MNIGRVSTNRTFEWGSERGVGGVDSVTLATVRNCVDLVTLVYLIALGSPKAQSQIQAPHHIGHKLGLSTGKAWSHFLEALA